MNKVTTINLNGNAYQLEEGGYELLRNYLEQARKNLDGDPDCDEILTDLERAIAEKCAVHLNARKTVITEKEVHKIINDMGPVEVVEDKAHEKEHADKSELQPKRLYMLRDGAIIGGVANGLAAYFNVDVTVIRLLFVLLVFASGGVWILVYLLMVLIVPEAETPEQKAELRGQKFSAQHVLDRARQKYVDISGRERWQKLAEQQRPALSSIGRLLQRLVRLAAVTVTAGLGILIGLLTAVWISGMWWLAFGHPVLQDQLSTISLWTFAAGATAVYFVVALPLGVLMSVFLGVGTRLQFGKHGARWLAAVASLWMLAAGLLIGVAAVTGGRISAYQANHARINLDNHKICINNDLCDNHPIYYYSPWQQQPYPPFPPKSQQIQVFPKPSRSTPN